jgi:hypothetical protein
MGIDMKATSFAGRVARPLAAAVCLLLLVLPATGPLKAQERGVQDPPPPLQMSVIEEGGQAPAWGSGLGGQSLVQACCKVCRKGKACGDSCIAKENLCTKPKGCACDAAPLPQ